MWTQLMFVVLGTGAYLNMKPECDQSLKRHYIPFEGISSRWHDGFERFDYVMDGHTMSITTLMRPADEQFGIGGPQEGERSCVVICPKHPAPGNPWSWRGCYWDHQPQTEIELLKRGFHIAYISADANHSPDKYWDSWYAYLTDKHGLSAKPGFIGMSRGGQFAFRWATSHPDKVSGIYADNPVMHAAGVEIQPIERLSTLAKSGVPVMHVQGDLDPALSREQQEIERRYKTLGGRITVLRPEVEHPRALTAANVKAAVAFILSHN